MKDRKNYPETSGTEQKAVRQASVGAVLEGYRNSLQRKTKDEGVPLQKKENNTGLPDNLKSGIENLSGHSLDDVKVHYNSAKPAQLQAHAYAQGTNIHIGPGQEKHLPHEAWHVVQQKQGRVRPTMQMKGINVNDDKTLEQEADVMGERAVNLKAGNTIQRLLKNNVSGTQNIQRMISVNGKEYNSQQQITDVMRDIETSCKLRKGDMGRFGKVIKELLQPEVMKSFTSYQELYNYLNPVLKLKKSVFRQDRFLNDEDALSIILYRAMGADELSQLLTNKQFEMAKNAHGEESGIKFFATDMNYSVKLANKKNNDAYKRQEKMPYEKMIAVTVNEAEVAYGLKDDIGIHADGGHTVEFLGEGPDEKAKRGENELRKVIKGTGKEDDTPQHGYVLKHETDGLNFGVKAKTRENTKANWKSPVEYFNSLVTFLGSIGEFKMVEKQTEQKDQS